MCGWRAIASERRSPPSTSARSSEMTEASFLSSVCSSRMTSAVTTLRPASIIVATVMSVGVLALFAMFESGLVQLRHASSVTTAAALADSEMEKYRALQYDAIGLTATGITGADSVYKADTAYMAETSPTTTLN